MTGTVLTKVYSEPEYNINEILRYAGMPTHTDEITALVNECIREIRKSLSYRVCYREFPIYGDNDALDLTFMKTRSKDLKKNLGGCESVVVFAATVGLAFDRLIARYCKVSPTRALVFQAIGAERIESLCDMFNEHIRVVAASEGKSIRPRFSPGYGDFPISAQTDIIRVLDAPRKIGLSLNKSLLMSPTKSVTAFIGISASGMACDNAECGRC